MSENSWTGHVMKKQSIETVATAPFVALFWKKGKRKEMFKNFPTLGKCQFMVHLYGWLSVVFSVQ